MGELRKLPNNIRSTLKKTVKLTKKNKRIIVNLAINYGSKNEILSAMKRTAKLNIKNFEKIFTKNMPDPHILIRTGGHQRLSNFLLWQLAYSELFFVNKLWPDFNYSDLKNNLKIQKNKEKFWSYMKKMF